MQIVPVGITGLLCVFGDTVSEETGDRVAAMNAAFVSRHIPGVIETIPSYVSLLVRYDPLVAEAKVLTDVLWRTEETIEAGKNADSRIVELPVCYGGDLGPDLAFVAEHAGLSEQEAIRLHSERTYRIYMLGFLPGFPYLGGLDSRLATPRLSTPRVKIPAGSVGIGGSQTGVYPMESPGGWRLIGRTPVRLFDPDKPLPYKAGDRIRFVPVTREEFDREAEKWQRK